MTGFLDIASMHCKTIKKKTQLFLEHSVKLPNAEEIPKHVAIKLLNKIIKILI